MRWKLFYLFQHFPCPYKALYTYTTDFNLIKLSLIGADFCEINLQSSFSAIYICIHATSPEFWPVFFLPLSKASPSREDLINITAGPGSAADKMGTVSPHSCRVNIRMPWCRHQMETFSALLAFCEGNMPVTGGFPSQRPVTRSFDTFFDERLNKRLDWANSPDAGD